MELPQVRNTSVDLLGETADGELIHIEVQSRKDRVMSLRMAEYCLAIFRRFKRFPRQIVLYVGYYRSRMDTGLSGPFQSFRYEWVDVRELDSKRLLESGSVGDNVIAILGRLRDRRAVVQRILARIADLSPENAKWR